MKIKKALFLGVISLSMILGGCGENKPNEEITATLSEVLEIYQKARNYTYVVDDQIFDVVSTLRYTENAYYYQPSTSKHGGEAYGYAENSTGIFKYTINEDKSVSFGSYVTSTQGEYVHDMWGMTILSFYDIELSSLPTTPEEGTHKYKITDSNNKLLISGLAGLGDSVLQEYIDVYIELTSNTTFKTIVHTSGLVGGYVGYAYGTIKDVGTTTIPEIQQALDEGKGPELIDNTLIDALQKLKISKNYKVTITGEANYVDLYTLKNSYSQNLDDDSLSNGYAGSPDGVYKYKIVDGEVVPGEIIGNGSGGSFSNIWVGIPGFYTFASISLTDIESQKNSDGTYTISNLLFINTFEQASHLKTVSAAEDNATITLKPEENKLTYTLNLKDGKTVTGVIDSYGEVSIPEIEAYIENGGGPAVYEDIDQTARDVISGFAKIKNYTLTITSTVNSGGLVPFVLTKKFNATKYYQEHSVDSSKTFGYLEEDTGVYSYTYDNDGNVVKGNQVGVEGAYLWSSGVFKGLSLLSASSITGKKLNSNTYEITDSTNKNYLSEIAGFGIYDLMWYFPTVTMTINDLDTNSVTFKIDCKEYGIVTIATSNINATEIA